MGGDDILNIQGEDIPQIDDALNALLEKGKTEKVNILPGSSNRVFVGKKPYAITEVDILFKEEKDLRNCVRLLRWSDERLIAMGSTILWAWNESIRERMKITFAVNWYDKSFFDKRKGAVEDENHLSYFKMFGVSSSDMKINTHIL